MSPIRVLSWAATAAILVLICVGAPRLAPDADRDLLPTRVALNEPAQLDGGTVTVVRILAAPRWTDGDATLSLQGRGYFVEVRARVQPDRRADRLRGSIRSDGRSYQPSDRTGMLNQQVPPGFTSPQVLTFEVPPDVLDDGSVRVMFIDGSAARVELTEQTVRRADVLEQSA